MDINPGMSLFQASELNCLNMSSQQPEELEAIEDEKRRDEELKEMLQNAFDDLEDEDKQTIDSSCLTTNIADQVCYEREKDKSFLAQHFFQNGGNQEINEINNIPLNAVNFKSTGYNTNNHLEILYSIRLREIERLHDEINNMKQMHAEEIKSIFEQLTFMESEKDKAEKIQKELEKNLNDEKERSSASEKEISVLKQNLFETRNHNINITGKLEIATMTITDLEERLKAVGNIHKGKNEEKQFDDILSRINAEHKREIVNMQKQWDDLSDKLICKETEYKRLEREFMELQRVHESVLIEKSDSLNRLAKKLEETQSNYQNLITLNRDEENFKLRISLDSLRKENEQLNAKLQSLTTECDILRLDLKQYEKLSKLSEYLADDNVPSDNDKIFQIGLAKNEGLRKLKDELHRAMINQKSKRNEIKELQNKLSHADGIIKQLSSDESRYKMQIKILEDEIKTSRDELNKLKSEISEDLDHRKMKEFNCKKRDELEQDVILLKEDNEKLKRELLEREKTFQEEKKIAIDHYSQEYMKFHEEKLAQVRQDITNEYQRKISELESRLDESVKECNEIKELYTDACISKDKLISSNENIKKDLNELKDANTNLNDRIKYLAHESGRLKKLLDEHKNDDVQRLKLQISQLQNELNSGEVRVKNLEQRIKNLNEQAKQQKTEHGKLQHKITLLKNESSDWKMKYEEANDSRNSLEHKKQLLEMENQLIEYRDKYRHLDEKYSRDIETIKLSAAECITKIKVEHSEKIAHLRIEHVQSISQLEIEHSILLDKTEKRLKNVTMQMLEEEVSRIAINCKEVLQQLMRSVEEYKNENAQLNKQNILSNELINGNNPEKELRIIEQKCNEMSEKCKRAIDANSKLCSELNVMQRKYENSRKAALQYKQLSEKRANLLRQEIEEHNSIIRSIQKQIDDAIDSKQAEVSAVLANVQKQLTISIRR